MRDSYSINNKYIILIKGSKIIAIKRVPFDAHHHSIITTICPKLLTNQATIFYRYRDILLLYGNMLVLPTGKPKLTADGFQVFFRCNT